MQTISAPRQRCAPMKGRTDDETDCANGGVGNRRVAGRGGVCRLRCGAVSEPAQDRALPRRRDGHDRERRGEQRHHLQARRGHRHASRPRAQRRRLVHRLRGRRGARPRRRAGRADAPRLPHGQDQALARPRREHRGGGRTRHQVVRPARDEHHGRGGVLRLSLCLQHLSLGPADTGRRPAPVARDERSELERRLPRLRHIRHQQLQVALYHEHGRCGRTHPRARVVRGVREAERHGSGGFHDVQRVPGRRRLQQTHAELGGRSQQYQRATLLGLDCQHPSRQGRHAPRPKSRVGWIPATSGQGLARGEHAPAEPRL